MTSKKRSLQFEKYNISKNRYLELKYFCRQYQEKVEELAAITEIGTISFEQLPQVYSSDKTGNTAIKKIYLEKEIRIVEEAAVEADMQIAEYILKNVTSGIRYEFLDVPYSRSVFYERRRKFFWILDMKLRMAN